MDIASFRRLDLDEKATVLWNKGSYIEDVREHGNYTISTYALFDFYVEVFYDRKSNAIKRIHPLETDADWHGYLESINLNYLLR